ncbi:early nodulin-like protein 9 [Perilla frutescens var. hirtella]|uniref:Early nodulin-like protein 9 n=1 Tax=Perilla frutescens var. hirtella TaxID=608512 RepID=A0AAD4PDE1_PERFH|nr:early nodulin-like protein 9 [Perilla frutescens var. hirtella]
MAPSILSLSLKRNSLQILPILSTIFLLIQRYDAFEFKVGGPTSTWTVPADPTVAVYNHWAEKSRFQIGDSLLFVYDANHDSVLHVTEDDYTNCNTASPLETFSDGNTVFQLNKSGPHYFISGVDENCRKNEKLVVVVMADRSNRDSNGAAPPPPSPSDSDEETPSEESSRPRNGALSAAATTVATAIAPLLVALAI